MYGRIIVLPPNNAVGRSQPFDKEYWGCYKLKEHVKCIDKNK